jgi:hypothetical protein
VVVGAALIGFRSGAGGLAWLAVAGILIVADISSRRRISRAGVDRSGRVQGTIRGMLTIGQLAAYAGVAVWVVRHYHQIGLLPELERLETSCKRMVEGERTGWDGWTRLRRVAQPPDTDQVVEK